MNVKKLLTMVLALSMLVLSLAACAVKDKDETEGMDNEPKNAEEAIAMHKKLMAQENAILEENKELWEKVIAAKK